MKYSDLPKWAKEVVIKELMSSDRFGSNLDYVMEYVTDKDDFEIVDYSADEDGTDLRVEY